MPESGYTRRKMATIGSVRLRELSTLVPMLYSDVNLLSILSDIAGESVLPVPDLNEQFVLNCLTGAGDTHGGHVDTYLFALNIIIEAPPFSEGGMARLVINSLEIEDYVGGYGAALLLRPGDAYFAKAGACVHGVDPLLGARRRVGLNFAYRAVTETATASYSSDRLYSDV